MPLNTAESLLATEITWLKKVQENMNKSVGDFSVDEYMLEGHLTLCRELLAFMPPEKKYEIGSSNKAGLNDERVPGLILAQVFQALGVEGHSKRENV